MKDLRQRLYNLAWSALAPYQDEDELRESCDFMADHALHLVREAGWSPPVRSDGAKCSACGYECVVLGPHRDRCCECFGAKFVDACPTCQQLWGGPVD